MATELVMSNGVSIPILGYGTWTSSGSLLSDGLNAALAAGYRHIDTAYVYDNEEVVGDVLKEWFDSGRLKRGDVFITTKLPGFLHRRSDVEKAIKESLEKLKLDYVDLYLIHTPLPHKKGEDMVFAMANEELVPDDVDHLETWRGMEDVLKKGLTRSIGLSNFNIPQMERIIENCTVKPQNLQVECHLYLPQTELHEFCKQHHIILVAYGPIGSPGRKNHYLASIGVDFDTEPIPLEDSTVKSIAQKHGKTAAQVLLRWLIQRDIVVIPKSTNAGRILENFNLFDFCLTDEEMKSLNDIKIRQRLFPFYWARNHPQYPWEPPQHK